MPTPCWWLTDDRKLSAVAREAIACADTSVYVSAATVGELDIKQALGRLDLGVVDLLAELEENRFLELPISAAHALAAGRLPRHHDDPFDRMLVAQALLEGPSWVTRDAAIARYDVSVLW